MVWSLNIEKSSFLSKTKTKMIHESHPCDKYDRYVWYEKKREIDQKRSVKMNVGIFVYRQMLTGEIWTMTSLSL